jgi:hypothetical protein
MTPGAAAGCAWGRGGQGRAGAQACVERSQGRAGGQPRQRRGKAGRASVPERLMQGRMKRDWGPLSGAKTWLGCTSCWPRPASPARPTACSHQAGLFGARPSPSPRSRRLTARRGPRSAPPPAGGLRRPAGRSMPAPPGACCSCGRGAGASGAHSKGHDDGGAGVAGAWPAPLLKAGDLVPPGPSLGIALEQMPPIAAPASAAAAPTARRLDTAEAATGPGMRGQLGWGVQLTLRGLIVNNRVWAVDSASPREREMAGRSRDAATLDPQQGRSSQEQSM